MQGNVACVDRRIGGKKNKIGALVVGARLGQLHKKF